MLIGDLVNPDSTSIRLQSSRYVPLARLHTTIKSSAPRIKLLSISPNSLGIKLMFHCISLETHPKLLHAWEQLAYFNDRVFFVIHMHQLIIMCIIYFICSLFHQLSIYIFISISRQTRFAPLPLISVIDWNAKKFGHLNVRHWCNDQISRLI